MKKAGSNLISFPKPRRVEQTGFTQKAFPARWLGLLLMTSMGAAWALSPSTEGVVGSYADNQPQVSEMVFEGEPQVVAQLMGATVGPDYTPAPELKALSARGASEKRVVVSAGKASGPHSQDLASVLEAVENVESEFSQTTNYPAICPTSKELSDASYQTNGHRFRLQGEGWLYDSASGLKKDQEEEVRTESPFKVLGYLQSSTTGWGPWKSTVQQYSAVGREHHDMSWLELAPVTPAWSARLYFPVSQSHTGYAFRKADGSSPYKTGEFLYDGVSGTFQLKLHRKDTGHIRSLSAEKLESQLSAAGGSELVGDAGLMADLGFLKLPKKEDSVVQLSSPARLDMNKGGALSGLALSTFTRHKKRLKPADYLPGDEEKNGSATVVGKLEVVDKLGQVHNVRMRAGRGTNYDWIVGQLCPVESASDEIEVLESTAYDDAYDWSTEATVKAGH